MSDYQKTDASVMLSEILVNVINLDNHVKMLSGTLNGLSTDVDTLTRSLGEFNKQLTAQKTAILEQVAKDVSSIVEEHLKQLRQAMINQYEPKRRWFRW